ncbi:hypothetical protein [Xanthobacter versatilis]|uniref:hypothetical protein n=1 Tax=Xanthobacter autotrophicus (strain ATCC BAA-1158 / Py2) TaxID=78245 RepID=UPI0037264DC2
MKTIIAPLAAAVSVFLFLGSANAACPIPITSNPTDASGHLAISKLSQLLVCSENDPMNDQSPCNTFASRGLESIYSVSDFKTASGFLSANAIWDYVNASAKWVSLGGVYNEDNNLCAQVMANQALPVIAVMKAPGHGHIALIIPGEPGKSGTWNMLVAYSASFLYNHPDKAYVGGLLSKAYQPDDAKKAVFFYRKGF